MSGRKRSRVSYSADTQRRMDLQKGMASQMRRIDGTVRMLQGILQNDSEGIRETHQKEVKAAEKWLGKPPNLKIKDIWSSSLTSLENQQASLDQILRDGGMILDRLSEIVTALRMAREERERARWLDRIQGTTAHVADTSCSIREFVEKTPEGLRDTFQDETEQALRWAQRTASASRARGDSSDRLDQQHADLERDLALGRQHLQHLIECYTRTAQTLEAKHRKDLAGIAHIYAGERDLIGKWFGRAVVEQMQQEIGALDQRIERKQFRQLSDAVARLEEAIDAAAAEAEEKEEKQVKMLEVYAKLRDVCRSQGFREIPVESNGEQSRDSIVYAVDTLDRGTIRFVLTLDDPIEATSTIGVGSTTGSAASDPVRSSTTVPIDTHACASVFKTISALLKERGGMETAFVPHGDGEPRKEMEERIPLEEVHRGVLHGDLDDVACRR